MKTPEQSSVLAKEKTNSGFDSESGTYKEHAETSDGKSLSWTDQRGNTYRYFANPLRQVCGFILILEMCERFCYYGFNPLLQDYVGDYMGSGSTDASVLISAFKGFLYATPVFSALLADTVLPLYWTIAIFSTVYLLGVLMLTLSPIPGIYGAAWYLKLTLMGFIAVGGGGIKACINVFGGVQFHPEKQQDMLSTFYAYFYAVINIGALASTLLCTQLKQDVSYVAAFAPTLGMLVVGMGVFYLGTPRYVMPKPQGSAMAKVANVYVQAVRLRSFEKIKASNGGPISDSLVADSIQFLRIFPILVVGFPFQLCYNLYDSVWVTQSNKLETSFFGQTVDPAMIQIADPISIVVSAFFIERVVYAGLKKRNMMPSVTTRYIIGLVFAAASMGMAIIVENRINSDGLYQVNAAIQLVQYALLGIGEIFCISTSYEVAYSMAPQQLKTLASAVNLLMMSLAYFTTTSLIKGCSGWLVSFKRSQTTPYVAGEYDKFYGMHIGFCAAGILVALFVKRFYKELKV